MIVKQQSHHNLFSSVFLDLWVNYLALNDDLMKKENKNRLHLAQTEHEFTLQTLHPQRLEKILLYLVIYFFVFFFVFVLGETPPKIEEDLEEPVNSK